MARAGICKIPNAATFHAQLEDTNWVVGGPNSAAKRLEIKRIPPSFIAAFCSILHQSQSIYSISTINNNNFSSGY
jgi:hypothetical protein